MFIKRFPGHSPVEHLKTWFFNVIGVVLYVILLFVRCDSLDAQHLVLI
jgi:hypothetical protein